YCTYFSTNKTESDEFVGALGLGSKSPFCYKEGKHGFTVVSRYEGYEKVYSAFLKNGLPTIVKQSEQPTKEGNGLEVSFPVDPNDCWEFSNKAERALEFFDPKPNLNCKINIKQEQYEVKSEKWGLRKGSSISGLRAIQGMVQYHVGNLDKS